MGEMKKTALRVDFDRSLKLGLREQAAYAYSLVASVHVLPLGRIRRLGPPLTMPT